MTARSRRAVMATSCPRLALGVARSRSKAESEFGENRDRFGARVTLPHQDSHRAILTVRNDDAAPLPHAAQRPLGVHDPFTTGHLSLHVRDLSAAIGTDLIEHALSAIDTIGPDGRTVRQFDRDLMLQPAWKLCFVDQQLG